MDLRLVQMKNTGVVTVGSMYVDGSRLFVREPAQCLVPGRHGVMAIGRTLVVDGSAALHGDRERTDGVCVGKQFHMNWQCTGHPGVDLCAEAFEELWDAVKDAAAAGDCYLVVS
jgi:hypothetical protein